MEQSYEEYSEEFNLESFDSVVLERESFDEFHLDLGSKNEKLFIGLKLSLGQIHDLINQIETFFKDKEPISNQKYLPGVLLEDDEGKVFLEIPTDQTFILITFSSKDEISKLLSKLKKASGWTDEILKKSTIYDKERVSDQRRHDQELQETFRIQREEGKRIEKELQPFFEFLKSNSVEVIVKEMIDYVENKYSTVDQVLLKWHDIWNSFKEYLHNKGMIGEYYLVRHYIRSNEVGEKFDELRGTYQKEIEKLIDKSKEKLAESLTDEILKFCKDSNKSKMTQSDLDRYLFEHKMKIPGMLKKIIYSKIKEKL